jgi:2-polyprenyl-6-hydroxyphenyl methylase/3-demethylubiquinone-9 3-methyltransferase
LALASAGWALDVIIGRGPDVQWKPQHADTRSFYDEYWPANVPDSSRTREHVLGLLPDREFERVLDAGCGTGVCSLALSERGREITALDLSAGSLRTARALAGGRGRANVRCLHASLLAQPFADATFDLAFSWGVIHHTPDPIRALDELVRTLRPGGTLVLAVYLRTGLTWLHEAIRWVCLRSPDAVRRAILAGFAGVVRVGERLGKVDEVRADNPRIESQVEDWFFVPEKHFFGIEEMRRLIEDRGLEFELLVEKTGRFRSSSNFIVRGTKPT